MPSADQPASSGLSVWSAWTDGQADTRLYATARAALAALLIARRIRRLWLPAYSCPALAQAATEARVELAWYGVDERLHSDIDSLRNQIAPEDAVLAIAWFGRPPEAAFHALAADCPRLLIVEDRAQALDPGGGIDGAVRLYSPRKLVGVADGGLLIGPDLPAEAELPASSGLWAANDGRGSDVDGLDPSGWFPAYQAREAAFDARPRRCSDRTRAALNRIDMDSEADARRRNWQALAASLADVALWAIPSPDFAPLAFPVVVDDAAGLVTHLAGRRIWAARHWADLPSPAGFADAHALSRRCVSLPLDGRYTPQDMGRVAEAVRAFTPPGQVGGAR